MKILLAHQVCSAQAEQCYANIAAAAAGVAEVKRFCVTVDPPGPRLSWLRLDDLWRRRDGKLMQMYQRLREAAADCDVLLNYNGANIHPELLKYLPTFNVFCCFDDPEASAGLSAPVAAAFDAAFYGNIASRFQYDRFGPPGKSAFLPIFFDPAIVPPYGQRDQLIAAVRTTDVSICCEYTPWRAARLDALVAAFPGARCHGSGWPGGRLSDVQLGGLYRDTRVGWNVHNSSGPVNQRTFMLPAFGVPQICDNKTGLGQLFRLGREAVGFDTVAEAVEATRWFLEHEAERRQVAAAGLERFWRDYHPTVVWRRLVEQLEAWGSHNTRKEGRVHSRELAGATLGRRIRVAMGDARAALVRALRSGNAGPHAAGKAQPPVDQRVCLGQRVVLDLEKQRGSRVRPAAGRAPNGEALCWAVTGLLGTARRIGVMGDLREGFMELAGVDGRRTLIDLDGGAWSGKLAELDVIVAVSMVEGLAGVLRKLEAMGGSVNRAILAVTGGGGGAGRWGAVCGVLRRGYGEVYAYRLRDADVPWLEPAETLAAERHLIVEAGKPDGRGMAAGADSQAARAA